MTASVERIKQDIRNLAPDEVDHLLRDLQNEYTMPSADGDEDASNMIWRENVVILAIAHAKRRPYYWRKRIEEAKEMF